MVTVLPMESPYTARMAAAVKALAEASVSASPDGVEAALADMNTALRTRSHAETRRSETLLLYSCATVGPAATAEATRSHSRSCVRSPSCTPTDSPTTQTGRLAESIPRVCSCQPRWDHIRPRARGGSWNERTNLVTACWPCNSGKADFTLEE